MLSCYLSDEVKPQVKLVQDEYVTGLSGNQRFLEGISNLTFHTNLGKHGPIGKFKDNYPNSFNVFDPEIRDQRGFGGFFGSYNSYGLSSIGIYANPTASSETVKPLSCSSLQK